MKYYKNIEISRELNINPTTVQNWIDQAKIRKNNLQLTKVKQRYYILKNEHNRVTLQGLLEKGKKFRQFSRHKTVQCKDEFFETFNEYEIADIITSIEVENEIPHKYSYFDGGAKIWSNYATRTISENISNTVSNTIKMLEFIEPVLLNFVGNTNSINILDLGCGDLTPIKDFLNKISKIASIQQYTALDISQSILEIAEKAYQKLDIDSTFRAVRRDISIDPIKDLIFYPKRRQQNEDIKNIILFLGSTIENQADYKETLFNIASDIDEDDIFLVGVTLESLVAKSYFNFGFENRKEHNSAKEIYKDWQDFIVPKMMGLSHEDFNFLMFYDEKIHSRMIQFECKYDITVEIKNKELDTTVNLEKGQKITTWRHRHHTTLEIIELVENTGLQVDHFVTSPDKAQALLICKRRV